ncbi:MAG: hypothetical protein KGI90_06805, partial [Burkholderiales bacterium]|nr:hypothetical protein [Burkholderiales bacterium]
MSLLLTSDVYQLVDQGPAPGESSIGSRACGRAPGLRHAICVLRSIGAHARNLHAVMTHPIIKKLCSALLALAAGLGAVGSAQG